jgi:hypothetical protein
VDQIMPLPSANGRYSVRTGDIQIAGCSLPPAVRRWAAICRHVLTADAPAPASSRLRVRTAVVHLGGDHQAWPHDATRDEAGLPDDAAVRSGGHDHLAAKVFRDTLLSAPGGEFALVPLDGPGTLLSQAYLLPFRREPPMPRDIPDETCHGGSPTALRPLQDMYSCRSSTQAAPPPSLRSWRRTAS